MKIMWISVMYAYLVLRTAVLVWLLTEPVVLNVAKLQLGF